jgi:hypothetical protein
MATTTIRALTIRQPWAHLITRQPSSDCPSPKGVENRERRDGRIPQPCRHRGPLLLHASAGCTRRECDAALKQVRDAGLLSGAAPALSELPRGGIVGYCQAIGHLRPDGTADTVYGELTADEVAESYDLRWWRGGHGLLLEDAVELPFVACPGTTTTWRAPDKVLAELERLGCSFDAAGQLRRRRAA